jgi:hypothetical protein
MHMCMCMCMCMLCMCMYVMWQCACACNEYVMWRVVKSPFFLQPSQKDRRCLSVCPVQDYVMDAAISNEIIYHETSKFHDRSCVTYGFSKCLFQVSFPSVFFLKASVKFLQPLSSRSV